VEKPADLISKLRQRLKLADCQRLCSYRHIYIVSRHLCELISMPSA
jgi:hypothetical protein